MRLRFVETGCCATSRVLMPLRCSVLVDSSESFRFEKTVNRYSTVIMNDLNRYHITPVKREIAVI